MFGFDRCSYEELRADHLPAGAGPCERGGTTALGELRFPEAPFGCGKACDDTAGCTAVEYSVDNRTCTLLSGAVTAIASIDGSAACYTKVCSNLPWTA
jgi:hypothetical protein